MHTLPLLLTLFTVLSLHAQPRALVIVVDGLRPDYVTPEIMPRLSTLRDGGFAGENHHAVFPTVTRVNSPSIATGSYPKAHGLTGNSLYAPDVAPDRILNTGEKADLDLLEAGYGGELLTAPTLGEILTDNGLRLFAASSGSSGSAYLMNYRPGSGALVHTEFVLPDTLGPAVEARIGPAPEETERPFAGKVRWAIDAVLEIGIDYMQADALMLWVTEPDGSVHANGVGSPEALEALRAVDRELGRLIDELERRGLSDTINLIVTADHGFSTHTGSQSIAGLLVEKGLKASPSSTDVVVAGGAIHVMEDREAKTRQIIEVLQKTAWIGPVFTRDGSFGTLPFSAIYWDHERSADILVAYNWNDEPNEFGYPGTVTTPGVAGHGSTSPFDIRTFFAISGPDVKKSVRSEVHTGNVDIAPTVLHLLGLPPAPSMDGRVLREALISGPDPDPSAGVFEDIGATWEAGPWRYQVTMHRYNVDGVGYVGMAGVER